MNDLIQDITRKLESISYMPGFTLDPDEALFYVMITELRLYLKTPLVIIERTNEKKEIVEYHTNGTKSEYILASYLTQHKSNCTQNGELDLCFDDEFVSIFKLQTQFIQQALEAKLSEKNRKWRKSFLLNKVNPEAIDNCRKTIRRYANHKVICEELMSAINGLDAKEDETFEKSVFQYLFKKNSFLEYCFRKGSVLTHVLKEVFKLSDEDEALKRFWHYDPEMRKFCFVNFLIDIGLLLADLSEIYENEFLDNINKVIIVTCNSWRITLFLTPKSDNTEARNVNWNIFCKTIDDNEPDESLKNDFEKFKKPLSHIAKYRDFLLSELNVPPRIPKSASRWAKGNYNEFIKKVKTQYPLIGTFLDTYKDSIRDIFEKQRDENKRIEKINEEIIIPFWPWPPTGNKEPAIFAKVFAESIYFHVFDNISSRVLEKFENIKIIKDFKFDFTLYLYDKALSYTWYTPSWKINEKEINLKDPKDAYFFNLKREAKWHVVDEEQGFSEYVMNTNYPQFSCNFHLDWDYGHRLIRFKKETWEKVLDFFRLREPEEDVPKIDCIQIPIVFSLIPLPEEHQTNCKLYGIYPIYNFNFNIRTNENENDPYKFFKKAFDFSFECMFMMSSLQKNQEDFLKAMLFEEATDAFKRALEFPLLNIELGTDEYEFREEKTKNRR